MLAPFPYFGGKRTVAADVWKWLGEPPACAAAYALHKTKRKAAA